MKRTIFCISTALFLTAVGISIWNDRQASAACNSGSDVAAWLLQPTATRADAQGKYSATLALDWAFQQVPFLGGAEAAASGNFNQSVPPTHTPSYFFPSSCTGGVDVKVSGALANPRLSGILRSKGFVWQSGNPAPYDEDIHHLTIMSASR